MFFFFEFIVFGIGFWLVGGALEMGQSDLDEDKG